MALDERRTIQLGNEILIDVDPSYDHVMIRMGTMSERVSKAELWAALFMIADEKTQDAMMPVRQTEMMTFERIHNVRAKRDIKRGDMVRFRCKVNVPVTIVESLKGLVKKETRSPLLL